MDQNESQDEEDLHYRSHHNCHRNFIRPSSSSSIRAPSWSLGFGADSSNDGEPNGHDCCCSRSADQSLDGDTATHCCRCHDESTATLEAAQSNKEQLPQCPTFYVDIPTVYLTRKDSSNSSSYHVYQVNIRTSAGAEWSIYRRYSQFLTLHQQLKACDSAIGKFSFPPKRRLNSKASTIVQERRRRLEAYLRELCAHVIKQPLDSSSESSSYQLLTSLASNGPTKLPRSSSTQSNRANLFELGTGGGSPTHSARSECTNNEHDGGQQTNGFDVEGVERAMDVDEMSRHASELGDGEEANGLWATGVIIEEADHLEPDCSRTSSPNRQTKKDCKSKTKGLRNLFYEFISPLGTNDAEFELDHLGV